MTPRWKIKFKCSDDSISEIKIYNADKQKLYDRWSKDFEIVSIEQDTDTSYVRFIDQIKSKSELLESNDEKQIYRFPHNDSSIFIQFYTDGNEYYDYCQYQRWDCNGLIEPTLWAPCSPKRFCELFDKDVPYLPQGIVVTPKEIKKMKAKKFCTKGIDTLWVDDLGYIYSAEKATLPTKRSKTQWERFHDNPNAVLVRYVLATPLNIHGNAKTEWFESKESFMQFYEAEIKNVPGYCTTPSYDIIKVGYKKKKPEERKVILRLPYIDLDAELAYGTPVENIALSWSRMCDKSWRHRTFSCYNYLVDVVKKYKAYLNK